MPPHLVYLHGFGSGPQTFKAAHLQAALADRYRSWSAPRLDGGDFAHLTMDGIIERGRAAITALEAGPVVVVGASLGGYVATLLAAEAGARIAALMLAAPAFGFTDRCGGALGPDAIAQWRRDGVHHFWHHEQEREVPLWVRFLDSCEGLPPLPSPAPQPTAILHGLDDQTVPVAWSRRYAASAPHVELVEIPGDHRLGEPEQLARLTALTAALLDRVG